MHVFSPVSSQFVERGSFYQLKGWSEYNRTVSCRLLCHALSVHPLDTAQRTWKDFWREGAFKTSFGASARRTSASILRATTWRSHSSSSSAINQPSCVAWLSEPSGRSESSTSTRPSLRLLLARSASSCSSPSSSEPSLARSSPSSGSSPHWRDVRGILAFLLAPVPPHHCPPHNQGADPLRKVDVHKSPFRQMSLEPLHAVHHT